MKKKITIVALLFSTTIMFAQNNFWKKSPENNTGRNVIENKVNAKDYQVYTLDINSFKDVLKNAPIRGIENINKAKLIVSFPNNNGEIEKYNIIETPVFHPKLEAKFPGIKSYAGQGIDNPASIIRFSVSNENGFYGMVMNPDKGSYFIDPFTSDFTQFMVYNRSDAENNHDFECTLDEADHKSENTNKTIKSKSTDDKKLRKYRLAL